MLSEAKHLLKLAILWLQQKTVERGGTIRENSSESCYLVNTSLIGQNRIWTPESCKPVNFYRQEH